MFSDRATQIQNWITKRKETTYKKKSNQVDQSIDYFEINF